MARRPLFSQLSSLLPLLESGYTVLTPNRRLSRAVIDAYDEHMRARGNAAWLAPAVLPLNEWCTDRWGRAVMRGNLAPRELLDVPRQRRLWRDIIAESEEQDGAFSLLSQREAAENSQKARTNLCLWRVDWSDPNTAQEFGFAEDSAAFLRWLHRFDARCESLRMICSEDAAKELLEVPQQLQSERVALLNFNEVPPLYTELLACTEALERVNTGTGDCSFAPLHAFPDARSELRHIARWCLERHRECPDGRFAVVLQDMQASRELLESFLRRDFDCLTRRYESLPVNFATGRSLDRVPLVRDALRVLATGSGSLSVADLIALLHSRFLPALPVAEEALGERLDALLALGVRQVSGRLWRQHMEVCTESVTSEESTTLPWDDVARLAHNGQWERRGRTPSQWIDVFRAVLAAWQWPQGQALDSLEHQQLEQWQQALDELARYDTICPSVSYAQALALLREQCSQALFQPRTDDAGIQVLGPLEINGLSFDAIWLSGMSSLDWPAAPRPNPYLPRRLQRELRMPMASVAEQQAQATQRLQRWKDSASMLCASFVALKDDASVAASPLLDTDDVRDMPSNTAQDDRWARQIETISANPVSLVPVALAAPERAAEHVGSASLQQMALCQFQAFAAQRLRVEPSPEPGIGLSASERGAMLHHALYRLFGELSDSRLLQSIDKNSAEKHVDQAAQSAIQALSAQRRELVGAAALHLEALRLTDLLRAWLEVERTRPEPFRVTAREDGQEIVLGDLTLRLRLDRVDQFDDGSRLIIDYKSGSGETPARWFDDPPQRPQLPLYALLEPPGDGVCYASLRAGHLAFRGVGRREFVPGIRDDLARVSGDDALSDMDQLRERWHEQLQALADTFVQGDAEVWPRTHDACRFCARFSLCRVEEIQ